MQREEKMRDAMLDALQIRLDELKTSIGAMVQKLETQYESINWPTFLDNFALISSHLTGLSKTLSNEIGTPLRNLTVLPLLLSPEHDDELWRLTEGRLGVFSHDLVPDYLRTKPDPSAEQRMLAHEQKANALSTDAAVKQVAQFTKIVGHVFDMVSKTREEWESESSARTGVQQTSSLADTQALVSAIGMGKGLIHSTVSAHGGSNSLVGMTTVGMATGPSGMQVPPAMRVSAPIGAVSPSSIGTQGCGSGGQPIAKAPSAIKTNIKSANAIHPYGR